MAINKLSSSTHLNASRARENVRGKKTLGTPGLEKTTEDTFTPQKPGEIQKADKELESEIAQRIFSTKGIQKGKYNYKIKSIARSKDGTIYTAYYDWNDREGDYISATSSDGKVKWDLPIQKDRLEGLKTGPDGTLYVRTNKSLLAFTPGGELKFDHSFQEEVKDHFIDSQGNNYFRKRDGNSIYKVDPEGNLIRLPLKLRNLTSNEIKRTPDDKLLFRDGNRVVLADLKKGEIDKSIEFKDPDEKRNCSLEDFHLTRDGGMLAMGRQAISVPNSHAMHADLHMGLGFGGFHWHLGPHLPPDDRFYTSTVIYSNFLFKLDKDGNVKWQTNDLGSSPQALFTGDDRMIFTDNSKNEDKKTVIQQVSGDGEKLPFAQVDGIVKSMDIRKKDDHIFIHHGDQITEFSPDGKVVRETRMDGDLKDKKIHSLEEDGQILLLDNNNRELFAWDPEKGKVTPLTDHQKDYSYKTEAKRKAFFDVEDSGEKFKIEREKDHVVVGGVKLPIYRADKNKQ